MKAEEYEELEKRVFELEHRIKNLSWALAMITDLFTDEEIGEAIARNNKIYEKSITAGG